MAFSKHSSKPSSKSVFSLLWEDIKKPINIGFPLILLYKIISTIQVLGMILEIAMRYFENTEGKWDFINIPRTFTFVGRFDFVTSDTVTSFAFVSCMILILTNYVLLVGVFIVRKIKFRKLEYLPMVLQHYMVLYHFVLFLPIHTFMIEVIHYSSSEKIHLFRSTSDMLFLALGICGLVFNFSLGLLNLRCYSSLYAQKTFTKRNASLSFCDMIFVAFLSIYVTLVPSTVYAKWIIMCVTLAYILINIYLFHSQLPFFQIKVLEVYCVCLGAKIAMCFSIIFTGIFDEFRTVPIPDLPLGGFILCFPICAYGQSYKMIKTLMNSITFEEKHYKTEDDVFIHILAIRYVFKKAAKVSIKNSKIDSTNWNMQLNGLVSRHNDTCFNPLCGCRTFLEMDEAPKSTGFRREKYKELEIIMMRDLYEKGVERLPNSELILLNLAQFYLLYLENYLRSYLVLQAFEKKANKSFETEILIEYLKKRVQERMQLKLSGNDQQGLIGDYKPNNLNVTELVQNEVLFIQLKKLVQEQLVKQLRFWDLIDNFELNTYVIENCCEEIDYVRGKIDKLWEGLSRINHKCSSHYLFFGLYQALINNTSKRGERYLNDYSRLHGINDQEKEGITNNNLYDTQTVVIKISMRRDKIGIVEDSSGDVDSLFGYQRSELIDTNVATVMSNFFKERHHTFVMNHFELGTENVLNKAKRLFGYHRDGYIFPIFLYVSIYPNVETGLSYMGIIRPRKVYNNYILLKSDGTIDSYSPELAEYLGLESRKKYNIVEVCPDFDKINSAFNYFTRTKYENLKEDIAEFRQDSNKKSPEYFVKVTGSDSQKANDTLLAPNKKDMASLTSDMMEESNRIGSMETKDEGQSTIKAKNSDKDKGGLRSIVKLKNAQKKVRRLNSEDIDEYKKVYEQFSINGSILTFLPQRGGLESSVKNFLCTVSDEIFDYSILRIITLGRNDENMEVEKETERPKNNGKPTLPDIDSKITLMEKEILLTTEQDDIGISQMPNFKEQQIFRNPFGTETPENGSPAFANEKEMRTLEELQFLPIRRTLEVSENQMQFTGSRMDMTDSKVKHTFTDKGSAKASDYTKDDHEELGIDFYDSRDFIQEMLQNGHDKNETSTSYISMKGGDMSKFEALLYRREEGRASNKLRSYFVIIGACFIMAILNTIITNTSLDNGSQKVQKLISVGQRINILLDMNYNSRMVYMYLKGYITEARHWDDKRIVNYPEYALTNLKTGAASLLKLNTDVMNDIYDMHEDSQPKLFSKMVQLEYPTADMREHNVDQLNVFEAIDTLALSALEITSQPLSSVSSKIEDIQYILLNSMNQLYLGLQSGYGVYEQDLEQALSGNGAATLGIGIGVLSLYCIFLVILLRDLTQNHQDKIRFWNSLTKLDILKGAGHKKMLLIMKDNFETSSNFILLKKSLMEAKRQELKELKASKAKEAQSTGFKKLKSYKLRNRNYFTMFPFIIVLAIIICFFVVTQVLVSEQMETKRLYMQEIIQSESYYELNLLTLNGLYEYISEKGTTNIEGQAIEAALENNLEELSNLARFVNNFDTKSNFDPKMFVQISICDIYNTEAEKIRCAADGQGINQQGLVSVLTFAKETMTNLMDFAKNSDKTDDSIKTALRRQNLLEIEIELPYISDMFALLSASLAESELSEQDTFKANQIIILISFILVLALLSYFAVWKGFKKLEGRKFDNMKILRIIPTHMILDSKMLKTYLLKSFKDDLSSITNKL